jgi:AcrR family transcriptional regulator
MTKDNYHHGDLRDALLKATEEALSAMPLEEVSLREIARRAGVSHAAPKHHFASLGQLFGEVAARGFELFVHDIQQAIDADADQTPESRLAAMARAYIRFAVERPTVYGLMFGKRENAVQTTPRLASSMIAAWVQLETQVEDVVGFSRGKAASVAVWSMVHGFSALKLERKLPPHVEADAAIDTVIRTLVLGLVAEQ